MEGYDAKFNPPLEKRLECPICLLAQREPMQTPCGHRFCSACILRALRETGPRCPVDNTKVYVHQLFKDNFAKREVLSLNVHCSADQCGCSWQGELRDLQVHNKLCELILIQCPNTCGYSCRRNQLSEHLPSCTNRPSQCPTCSIQFPQASLADHQPHCSSISLPDSVSASLDKAGELLKWIGHLKLKLNGQATQVTGYLTAKIDSEESFLSTGCWCSTISLISLNTLASRIFSRILQSSEVQPVQLNFSLLTSDAKSVAFQKLFKKKPEICNAAVCLRLRPGTRRETRELTIMYLSWSEQRKRLLAYVANLKTHLVRQIQTHLHDMQGSRRHRDHSRLRHRTEREHNLPHSHSNLHRTTPSQPRTASAPQNHHPHLSHQRSLPLPQMHVQPPRQMYNVHPVPPHQQEMQSVVHPPLQQQHVVAAAGSSPGILPNLLSWQMSQSLNTYPWRMQATGVPFFTFPSTPPSYIPANSYPYTFAPLPAAPFSISPMQPVPSSVHMSTYTGLPVVVPQVTTVDTNAIPLNSNQALAGGVATQGYAVAAPNTAVPSQTVTDRELQAVAVTLGGEGNPVLHVLQPHPTSRPDHQLHHQYQSIAQGPLNVPPNALPALIPTDPPAPIQPVNNTVPFAFEVVSQPVHHPDHHSSGASRLRRSQQLHSHDPPLPPSQSALTNEAVATHPQIPLVNMDDSRIMWADVPGPSGLNQSTHAQSASDTSRDSSPDVLNFPAFSPDNDSDDSDTSQTPDISVSPVLFDESTSSLSSDQEDSPGHHLPADGSAGNNSAASALHTLADAAAILADSPDPVEPSAIAAQLPQSSGQPVRLPVLINISDSDSDSRLSPSSIIDLTNSPTASATRSSTASQRTAYSYIVSTPSNTAQHTHMQQPSLPRPVVHHQEPAPLPSENRISAVLVPVIHQWNGTTEQQGMRGIQHYLPSEQVGVVQAAQMGVEEVAHMLHSSGSLNSEAVVAAAAAAAPVQIQPQYAVQDYPRNAPLASWPTELPAQAHAIPRTLLYPHQHAIANRPPGDFWDTVIPSLDMTLQQSTTTDS